MLEVGVDGELRDLLEELRLLLMLTRQRLDQ